MLLDKNTNTKILKKLHEHYIRIFHRNQVFFKVVYSLLLLKIPLSLHYIQ